MGSQRLISNNVEKADAVALAGVQPRELPVRRTASTAAHVGRAPPHRFPHSRSLLQEPQKAVDAGAVEGAAPAKQASLRLEVARAPQRRATVAPLVAQPRATP